MRGSLRLGLIALPILAALGCGGSKVMVPPRIDLQQHEVLAVIEFSSSNKGELGPLATTRFMEEVRLDQGLIRIVGLGSENEALQEVGKQRLDPSAYKQLGQVYDVATIFTGELVVSGIRPAISITTDLSSLGAAADNRCHADRADGRDGERRIHLVSLGLRDEAGREREPVRW